MKIKHMLLLGLTLSSIVFFQPLIQLLGGVVLIAAALAYIYSDLPAQRQQLWDRRVSRTLEELRTALKNRGASARMEDGRAASRLTRRRWRADVHLEKQVDAKAEAEEREQPAEETENRS